MSCSYYGANVHDVKTIETSLQGLSCKIRHDRRFKVNLVGDKGYIINPTKKDDMLRTHKMKLVTPYRSNQTIQSEAKTPYDRLLLKQRYKVEHLFCRLDKFIRLRSRVDRYIDNYKAFNLIAMTSITIHAM